MKCGGCGSELAAGSKFCPQCGRQAPVVEERVVIETRIVIQELPPIMDAEDVAKALKVSAWTVYDMAQRGELPSLRIRNCLRFRTDRVMEWLDLQQAGNRQVSAG